MRNRSINGLPAGLKKFWVSKEFRTHEWSMRNYGFDVVVSYKGESARAYDAVQMPPRYIDAIKNRNDFDSIFVSIYARYFDPRTPKDQDFVKVWQAGDDDCDDYDYDCDYSFTDDIDLNDKFDDLKQEYDQCPVIPGMAITEDTNRGNVARVSDDGETLHIWTPGTLLVEPDWLTDNGEDNE